MGSFCLFLLLKKKKSQKKLLSTETQQQRMVFGFVWNSLAKGLSGSCPPWVHSHPTVWLLLSSYKRSPGEDSAHTAALLLTLPFPWGNFFLFFFNKIKVVKKKKSQS